MTQGEKVALVLQAIQSCGVLDLEYPRTIVGHVHIGNPPHFDLPVVNR